MAGLSEEMKLAIKITAQDTTKQAFGSLNSSLGGLRNAALAVAGVVTGALAFREVIEATNRLGHEMDILRDELGLTASEASQLFPVLRTFGIDAATASRAFGHMTTELVKAVAEDKVAESAFGKFGIKVQGASGEVLVFNDVITNVSAALRALPPGFARTNAAMEIFGERVGRRMIDFLTADDAEIKDIIQDMREWGLVMDEEGLDALERFNRQSERMGLRLDAIKLALGRLLLPILIRVFDGFRKAAGAVKAFGEALQRPLGIVKEFVERIGKFLGDIKAVGFAAALQKLVEDAVAAAREFLPKIGEALDSLGPVGWALKVLLIALAIEWAVGVLAGVAAKIVQAALSIPGVSLAPAGARAPIAYTLSSLFVMSIVATQFVNDVVESGATIAEEAHRVARAIVVGAGLVIVTAIGAAIGLPFAIAVSIGLVLGMAAVEFGPVAVDMLKDLGPQMLHWIVDNIAPHLPFPLSLVGNVIRAIINIVPEFRIGAAIPPPSTFQGPPREQREGISLPPIDTLSLADQQAWLRQAFPQNFPAAGATGGPLIAAQHGGIFTRPTAALIGERGPEAVIPLSRGAGMGPINITINGDVDSRQRVRELADAVSEEIMRSFSLAGNWRYARAGGFA